MLVFSLDLLRVSSSYYRFSTKAAQVEERAEQLMGDKKQDLIEAIKLMQQYHLARATAPTIHSWIYQLKRNDLNEMWQTYRRRSEASK